MILTNVYGVALTLRATAPALVQTRGDLVIVGSVAGRVAIPGDLYSATKWAIAGMAESVRRSLARSGVRVILIEPGRVDTPLQTGRADVPLLRAEDVAAATMFALDQPRAVAVNELVIRPTDQEV
jgi:NADP-dependent 3-hydroxy acid dehydrogenase YdfG